MAKGHISLPKPFASGDVKEWFDICCTANKWMDATKVAKFPTLMEGEAIAIWLELSEEQQHDYNVARKEITTTMIPTEFVCLDQFHSATRRNIVCVRTRNKEIIGSSHLKEMQRISFY